MEFLTYLKYISIFFYGYDLLLINQWENVGSLICEYPIETQYLCIADGNTMLENLDLNKVESINRL